MGARRIAGCRFVPPRVTGTLLGCVLSISRAASAAEDYVAAPVQKQVDTALHSVLLVGGVLVVLILVAVAIIVYRKAFSASSSETPPPPADPLVEAATEARRGNYGAAASHYEAGGDKLKAAEYWEKAKDFARAAECWEAGGELDRAAQFHVRSGSALRAAGIYMKTKNYIEAAKIFRNKGDHLRAAQALELFGNRLAAAREYTAAGNHAHAARVLEKERLYAEAAEAYQPLLGGDPITVDNVDHYCVYAALLTKAGEKDRAIASYRRVLEAQPGHPRAVAALKNLLPRSPVAGATEAAGTAAAPQAAAPPVPATPPVGQPERRKPELLEPHELDELVRDVEMDDADVQDDPLHRVFTLRSMIHAGRMEPRYCMRLWVQVMRTLSEHHNANMVLGHLTPDSIVIDMENNVRIDVSPDPGPVYLSPEVQAGLAPNRQADIYSMGVILYELVCGSLDQFGKKRAGELFPDVPSWLDELIEHCTEKNLTRRYRTTEEVSSALRKLMTATQE